MRLLNTSTERLETFADELVIPPYAILSHTWGDPEQEILFSDLQSNDTAPWQKSKSRSWAKIKGTCVQARKAEIDYVWIDTCCIDKSSSAELQEAINSMFRWYENAQVCFAYLSDLSPAQGDVVDVYASGAGSFRNSRWFTRGWTLQELLAPLDIIFFDEKWVEIALKRELSAVLEQITGIRSEFIWRGSVPSELGIGAFASLSRASIAEKMSWMSKRQTTRREDIAYCMLGIFDIHMPMLYGEGARAFTRLQEELMKITDDMSLFAWGLYRSAKTEAYPSILAPSPDYFEKCGNISSLHFADYRRPTFSMSQQGLVARVLTRSDRNFDNISYIILHCGLIAGSERHQLVVLPVISIRATKIHSEWDDNGHFVRPGWCRPFFVSRSFLDGVSVQTIRIVRSTAEDELFWEFPFNLQRPLPTASPKLEFHQVYPPNRTTENLVSLRDYPISKLYDQTRLVQFTSSQLVLEGTSATTRSQRRHGDESSFGDSGMVLILTGMPNGVNLLVALCQLDSTIEGSADIASDVVARVFRPPENLSLEAMYTVISGGGAFNEIPRASSTAAGDAANSSLRLHRFHIDHDHRGTLSLSVDTALCAHTPSGSRRTTVVLGTAYTKDSPAMALITKSQATSAEFAAYRIETGHNENAALNQVQDSLQRVSLINAHPS